MNNLLESYIANSTKTVSIELSIGEYIDLVVDGVNMLTDVNLDGCISSSFINDDLSRIGTYVDRVLLDPEDEDNIDILYHNPFEYYVEPSELFTINIIKHLFRVDAGEVLVEAFEWYGDYRYRIIVNEKILQDLGI